MLVEAVCRVCLVNNLNLYSVRNDLQNVYETITREKYNEAGYPVSMCYICLAALRKCHRFMETARDANSSLKQFYNQQCQMAVAKPLSIYSVRKQEIVSIDSESNFSQINVKQETVELEQPSDVDVQTDHYQVCEEIEIEIKPKIETNDEQPSHENDIPKQEREETVREVFVFESKFKPKSEISISKKAKEEEKLHICEVCNESCTSARSLKRHITVKHPTENQKKKQFCCNICEFKSAVKGQLTRHLKRHSGEKPFKCDHCDYKCIQQCELTNHMRIHTGEKPFSCNICNFKSSWRRHLTSHMRTHTGEKPYLCNICGHKCALKSYLYRHMKIHGGKLYCDHCKYKTTFKSKLAKHIMRNHSDENTFKCNSCSYESRHKRDLTSHMKVHRDQKPLSCNICGYKYRANLKRHMRIHTGEKPYSCNICSYQCTQKASLNIHVMRKHNGEMPLSCDFCTYKCATRTELTIHVRSHTGEKPFSCDVCDYKCTQKTNLTHHMKTHTGVKPYSCSICSYRCIQKSTLNIHMRKHTG